MAVVKRQRSPILANADHAAARSFMIAGVGHETLRRSPVIAGLQLTKVGPVPPISLGARKLYIFTRRIVYGIDVRGHASAEGARAQMRVRQLGMADGNNAA